MKNFEEIRTEFENFSKEFENMVNDSFGKRLKENELREFTRGLDMYISHEKETEIKTAQIKMLLNEARMLIPITGF